MLGVDPDGHQTEQRAADAELVLCDLERGNDLRPPVGAADAIVFAATRA
jgi:hypothetical protein